MIYEQRHISGLVKVVHFAEHMITADVELGYVAHYLLKGFAFPSQKHSDRSRNDQLPDFFIQAQGGCIPVAPVLINLAASGVLLLSCTSEIIKPWVARTLSA